MRTPFVEGLATLSLIVASCGFPNSEAAASCDDDHPLCPESSRAATSVTCDCKCTVGGISDDTASVYNGHVSVCLPAELNATTASTEQQVALAALAPSTFDQRVYGYCSRDVAGFLRTAIRSRATVRVAACAMPVRCDCTTAGTRRDSSICHADCKDTPCELKNCSSVLHTDATVGLSSCVCSRASSCGTTSPPMERSGICRDWTAITIH